MSIEEVGLIS